MTKQTMILGALFLFGCGETATEAAPVATPPAEATAVAPVAAEAPAAPATPAGPVRIGTYGVFQLSANTISVNGQCMEIAAELPADPTEAAAMQAALRAMAERTARSAGPNAVSTDRCPTEGRVAGVQGGCAMTMPTGAYISYFYATGEHPSTAEAAQTQCTQVHGVWTE